MAHPFDAQLRQRSNSQCELCDSSTDLSVFEVPPTTIEPDEQKCLLICSHCQGQIEGESEFDANHWRCLQTSAWSQIPSIQVVSWRLLKRLQPYAWAQELFEQIYLDDVLLEWAQDDPFDDEPTVDSNGTQLLEGDSVQIIKDLNVKGTGFVAKRGTIVKGIRLTGDSGLIEGRVNKTTIVLKTEFLKRTGPGSN